MDGTGEVACRKKVVSSVEVIGVEGVENQKRVTVLLGLSVREEEVVREAEVGVDLGDGQALAEVLDGVLVKGAEETDVLLLKASLR